MRLNYAVVAHFDAFNKLDQNFRIILSALEERFDSVILVTTCQLRAEDLAFNPKTTLIVRPNIGYDFYSYRVGYEYIKDNFELGNILFTNSSYFVIDPTAFEKTLDFAIKAINNYDVIGLTGSNQISWHIQSYFLFLNSKVLNLAYVHIFFKSIRPLNSKFELITQYELGFSRLITDMGLSCNILFSPRILERMGSYYEWGKKLYQSTQKKWRILEAIKECSSANLTHFCAASLLKKNGIIKAEVLRTNPHSLDLSFLDKIRNQNILISVYESIKESKSLYQTDGFGMTNLISIGKKEMEFREVSYGIKARIGVRIAVVIHLYYFDLLDEIASYLHAIIEPYDLYVTTPFEADISSIINKMCNKAVSVTVLLSKNSGRDIGPFIYLYKKGYLDGYMAVLKLHSKKSKYSLNGDLWRNSLYRSVIGNSIDFRRMCFAFEEGVVGMIGPKEYYLTNNKFWGSNKLTAKKLLAETGLFNENQDPELGFFAGSMFWFSPEAFNPIKKIGDNYNDFGVEKGLQDGTLAHAYERIFALICKKSGFKISSIEVHNFEDISNDNNYKNNVPVL
jgi:lipopolysaccharide biosynthesis protein